MSKLTHWETVDNVSFFPRPDADRKSVLPPGLYELGNNPMFGGVYFEAANYKTEDLLRFEDTVIDEAVSEIKSFWKKEALFKKHNFPFKRGILLYGPPGTGKSCTIKMIVNDIIKLKGIAINVDSVDLFNIGMKKLRDIQPETPVVAVMEDIDSLIQYDDESTLLNMLDGMSGFENVVYLATTNFIDKLQSRVKDRPSRFDRRFYVGYPSYKSRLRYLKHIVSSDFKNVPIKTWAKDTDGLSLAHLKELYIAIMFFNNNYDEVLERLRAMTPSDLEEEEDDLPEDLDMEFEAEYDVADEQKACATLNDVESLVRTLAKK